MKKEITNGMTGVAGEYAVAMELSKRGIIATVTLRNTKGIDILASNEDGSKVVSIQVKTSKNSAKKWILSEKCENQFSDTFFYVFVNINLAGTDVSFHIVPSQTVANFIKKNHKDWISSPGKNGQDRNENSIRIFHDTNSDYLNRWDLLGFD